MTDLPHPPAAPEPLRHKRVLLVEPAADDARLIGQQLQGSHSEVFEVQWVRTLAQVQALSGTHGFLPDVVLLNLQLSDSSGVAGVERCRALVDAPIVVLTALDDEAANRAVIESGAEDYLVKGGSGAALRKAVRYAMLRYERDHEARLATAVFTHAHEGIMITNPSGIIVDVNPALSRISGYSAQELIGQHPRMLLSAAHQAESYSSLWREILTRGAWQGERTNRHKDGHDYTAWESIKPCRNPQGRIVHYIGVMIDISARKLAEAQLLHSTQLLRTAIEAIDEAFVLFDADDRMVFCNDKYRQSYATSADLIVPGARFEDIIREGARRGQYAQALGREDAWVAERLAQHRRADSTLTQHLDDGRVLRIIERQLPDGGNVGFRIDITDLVRATEEAQAANLAKSRFLAVMSHEIRTPMNGILGMAQLLLAPQLSEHDRLDYAHTVLSSGQSLLSLLNDILDLSKIEAGKFQLDLTEVDPQALLAESWALFAGAARNKGLVLEVTWHGPPGQRYRSDLHRLRQMLNNLVGNAVKFTHQGHIHIEARELDHDNQGAVVEFAVTDTGVGIAADKLALLFIPFSQADSTTTRQFGGSGLGLSIVHSLAKLLGGDTGVQSVPGAGSRFWFRVRLQRLASATSTALAPAGPLDTARAATPGASPLSGRVLVVEDNAVNRMVIEGLLTQLGLAVTLANDGQQALDHVCEGHRPDAILMDVQMPVMDGYAATSALRHWETAHGLPRTPIIALTADAFEEDRQRCLASGMDDFLPKPIAITALGAALQKWLPPSAGPGALPTPEATLQPLDWPRFETALAQLMPLLALNKFDAIAHFETLQALAADTALSAPLAEVADLVKTLRFKEAASQLQQLAGPYRQT